MSDQPTGIFRDEATRLEVLNRLSAIEGRLEQLIRLLGGEPPA